MTDLLDVRLLGGLTFSRAGRPLIDFRSRKAEAILVYLLMHPEPVARADLAALFWDDSERAQANANLRKTLSDLRRHVGAWLLIDKHALAFDRRQPYRLDVADFNAGLADLPAETLLTPAMARTAARALARYEGPFLAGFHVSGARAFADWVDAQRYQLAALARRGLAQVGRTYFHYGETRPGVAAVRRLLALEPLDESAHRLLLRLLARAGRFSSALTEHLAFRRLLERELGVPPEPATVAVFETVRQARAQPSAATWLDDFVGRRGELANLSWQLDGPAQRLITITGLGGAGKTRLARHLP